MANRHKAQAKFAKGGRTVYTGKGSNVEHEAESTGTDHNRGGTVKRKEGGRIHGRKSGGRVDKRARGGGIGADHSPFSSAATGKNDVGRTSHTIPVAHPKGG